VGLGVCVVYEFMWLGGLRFVVYRFICFCGI